MHEGKEEGGKEEEERGERGEGKEGREEEEIFEEMMALCRVGVMKQGEGGREEEKETWLT